MPTGVYVHTEIHKQMMSEKMKGKRPSCTLDAKAEKSPNWKGGKPKCEICGKQLSRYDAIRCQKHPSPVSEETREKKRNAPHPSGWKHTPETKKKLSISHTGIKYPNRRMAPDHKAWNKGLKGFMAGEKNNHWKGGITPINLKIRGSMEMKQWRTAVFERDNYTCVWCKARGYKGLGKRVVLNADHIKSFAEYPELRFELSNGRTLCFECHKTTENWGINKRWTDKRLSTATQKSH